MSSKILKDSFGFSPITVLEIEIKLNLKHCFTDFAVGSQALELLPSRTSLSFFPEEIEEKMLHLVTNFQKVAII